MPSLEESNRGVSSDVNEAEVALDKYKDDEEDEEDVEPGYQTLAFPFLCTSPAGFRYPVERAVRLPSPNAQRKTQARAHTNSMHPTQTPGYT